MQFSLLKERGLDFALTESVRRLLLISIDEYQYVFL